MVAVAQLALAEQSQLEGGKKKRWIGEFMYAARSWERHRRVIAQLEHDERGANPRFLTSFQGGAQAPTSSCTAPAAKPRTASRKRRSTCSAAVRVGTSMRPTSYACLLAALAYTLMIHLRRMALKGTQLERACSGTIRTKLLKIGAAVVRNTRRVRLLLASSHPMKHVSLVAARALAP